MPNEINFTRRAIEALPAPKKGRDRYLDQKVRGLGLLVQPSGHKSFYWFRKVRDYPRRETLGRFPDLTVEQARDAATGLNNRLAVWKAGRYEGENPFASRREEMTLDEIAELYIEKQLRPFAKKPEQAEKDFRSLVSRRMAPWRARTLGSIEQREVEDVHAQIGEKEKHERAANVFVKTLRVLYSFAERKKLWKGANPAKGFTLYAEAKRARFLQPGELPQLFAALRRAPNPDLRDFVNLSLWTGARKMDVLSMRWQDVSLEDNRWTIPDPKNRIPYVVPLTREAVEILGERLRARVAGCPWVFPSYRRTRSGHLVDLKKRWRALLKDAGLDDADLRIHDLRRTQGSWQAGQGASLQIIGKSLGHASTAATAIYSRVDISAVRSSMESANAAIAAAMRKQPTALPAAPKRKKAAAR